MTKGIANQEQGDYEGAKIGMWIFLFTELLFFGGLFLLYAVYRSKYLPEFQSAADSLDVTIGTINTIILITSSFTMAMSISAMKINKVRQSTFFQFTTLVLGIVFLVLKYIEWNSKISNGIWPGSPELVEQGKIIFYSLYFVMTGLHAFHVLIGILIFCATIAMTHQKTINNMNYIKLENSGLYWHFVDIVWIYLFPFIYLIT